MNKHGNTDTDILRARALRNNPSPFEQKLWVALREQAKQKNLKFRRQQPLHPYIVDFACLSARLVVELNGDSHDARQDYDAKRDQTLKQMGFTILRFQNSDILESLDHVVATIVDYATTHLSERNQEGLLRPPSLTLPTRGRESFLTPILWRKLHNA